MTRQGLLCFRTGSAEFLDSHVAQAVRRMMISAAFGRRIARHCTKSTCCFRGGDYGRQITMHTHLVSVQELCHKGDEALQYTQQWSASRLEATVKASMRHHAIELTVMSSGWRIQLTTWSFEKGFSKPFVRILSVTTAAAECRPCDNGEVRMEISTGAQQSATARV